MGFVARAIRLGGVIAALSIAAAAPAAAADRVYWANAIGNSISWANLDGSGGGNLNTAGATVRSPYGVAIDPVTGRIYWANSAMPSAISWASLDGSGGGDLDTSGATVSAPVGIAVDPVGRRVYWTNSYATFGISSARLSGGGGMDVKVTGATMNVPWGLVVDPAAAKLYWSNQLLHTLSMANLDGSGGGDLNTSGAANYVPAGVAVDPGSRTIYWANSSQNTISNRLSLASLAGTGGHDLAPVGATVDGPEAVALDPTANRMYWTNFHGNAIAFANLDGSAGANLNTGGATVSGPAFLALLESPRPAGTPAIQGGLSVGSVLTCSEGSWAPDVVSALLYRSPRRLVVQWSRGGRDIPGATSSTYRASTPGTYRCRVTASNQAGSSAQTSPPQTIGGKHLRPVISALRITNRTFAAGQTSTPLRGHTTAAQQPRGTVFVFKLNQVATVTVTIERRRSPAGHRIVLSRIGHFGVNRLIFTGRIRGRALLPGRYRATFVARGPGGTSKPRTATFTLVP